MIFGFNRNTEPTREQSHLDLILCIRHIYTNNLTFLVFLLKAYKRKELPWEAVTCSGESFAMRNLIRLSVKVILEANTGCVLWVRGTPYSLPCPSPGNKAVVRVFSVLFYRACYTAYDAAWVKSLRRSWMVRENWTDWGENVEIIGSLEDCVGLYIAHLLDNFPHAIQYRVH